MEEIHTSHIGAAMYHHQHQRDDSPAPHYPLTSTYALAADVSLGTMRSMSPLATIHNTANSSAHVHHHVQGLPHHTAASPNQSTAMYTAQQQSTSAMYHHRLGCRAVVDMGRLENSLRQLYSEKLRGCTQAIVTSLVNELPRDHVFAQLMSDPTTQPFCKVRVGEVVETFLFSVQAHQYHNLASEFTKLEQEHYQLTIDFEDVASRFDHSTASFEQTLGTLQAERDTIAARLNECLEQLDGVVVESPDSLFRDDSPLRATRRGSNNDTSIASAVLTSPSLPRQQHDVAVGFHPVTKSSSTLTDAITLPTMKAQATSTDEGVAIVKSHTGTQVALEMYEHTEALRKQREGFNELLQTFHDMKHRFEVQQDALVQLQEASAEAADVVQQLLDENATLRSNSLQSAQAMTTMRDELVTAHREATSAADEADTKLVSQALELRAAQSSLEESWKEILSLKEQVAALEHQLSEVSATRAQSEMKLAEHSGNVKDMMGTAVQALALQHKEREATLEVALADLSVKCQSLIDQIAADKAEHKLALSDMQLQKVGLERQLGESQRALAQSVESTEKAGEEIERLQAAVSHAQQQLHSATCQHEAQITSLQHKVDEAARQRDDRVSELSQRLADQAAAHEQQRGEMRASFSQSVAELQQDLAAFQKNTTDHIAAQRNEDNEHDSRKMDLLAVAHAEQLRLTQENTAYAVELAAMKVEHSRVSHTAARIALELNERSQRWMLFAEALTSSSVAQFQIEGHRRHQHAAEALHSQKHHELVEQLRSLEQDYAESLHHGGAETFMSQQRQALMRASDGALRIEGAWLSECMDVLAWHARSMSRIHSEHHVRLERDHASATAKLHAEKEALALRMSSGEEQLRSVTMLVKDLESRRAASVEESQTQVTAAMHRLDSVTSMATQRQEFLETEVAVLTKRNDELNSTIGEQQRTIAAAEQELVQARRIAAADREQLEAASNASHMMARDLQEDLKEARHELKTLQAQHSTIVEDLHRSRSEAVNRSNDVSLQLAHADRLLEQESMELRDARKQLDALQSQLSASEDRRSVLETSVMESRRDAEAAAARVSTMSAEAKDIEHKYRDANWAAEQKALLKEQRIQELEQRIQTAAMAHAQTSGALRLREEQCAELSERIVSLERGHEQQLHSMRGSFEDSVLGLQRNLEAFQRTATLAHNSENSDQERRLVDKLSTAHEELLRMTQENGELYVNLSVQKHELINLRSDLAALRQEHSGLVDEHSQLRDVFETVKEQRDAFRAASIHLSAAPTPSVEVRAHCNNNAGGGGGLFSQFSPIVHREASDDVSPKTSDTPVRNVSSNDNQQHQNNTSAQLLDVITATLQQHEARVLHEVDRIRQIAEARPTHAEGAAPSADDSVTSSLNALLMGPVGTTAPLPEAAEPSAHEVLRFALQTLNTVTSVLGVTLPVDERLLPDTTVGESSVSNLFTHVAHLSRAVIHAAIKEQRRMSALESGTSSSVDSLVTAFTSLTSDHSAQVLQSYQSWVGDSLTAVKDQVKDLCALLRSEQCIHAVEKESQASRLFAQHFAPLRESLVAFAQRHRAIAEEKDSALLMITAYEEASKKQQDADHHKPLEPLHPVKQLATASTQVTPEPTPQAHAATQTVQDASTETMPEPVVVVEHRSATPPTIQVTAIMMATTATNTDDVLSQPTASQKEDDAEYAAFLSKAHRILEEHQALSLEVDAVRASEEKAHASAQEWQRTSTELEAMLDNECTLVSDLRGALTSLKGNMSDVQRYYAVQLALLSDQLHNVCQRCIKEEKRNATLHERCAAKEKRIGELIALTKVSSPPMRHSDTQSFHTTGRAHSSSVGQSNIRAPSSFLTSPSSQHGANSASSPVTRPIYFKQQRASSQSGHMRSLSRDWSPSGLSPSPVPGVLQ